MDKETYTIINAFFVLDKFTKSIKFLLKDCFNKKHNLNAKDRTFFNFYNKDFSENYLMKNVLNNFKELNLWESLLIVLKSFLNIVKVMKLNL